MEERIPRVHDPKMTTACDRDCHPSLALRVLIFSAAIGEGHDLPARVLANELAQEAPGTRTRIVDGLGVMGWPVDGAITRGSPFHSAWGNRLFDAEYWLIAQFPPTRWV